jgi:hypothetical protein
MVSGLIASTGHSGSHTPQSVHSSVLITTMFSPSKKQSTGHTSMQSWYLQLMQASIRTYVIHHLFICIPMTVWMNTTCQVC